MNSRNSLPGLTEPLEFCSVNGAGDVTEDRSYTQPLLLKPKFASCIVGLLTVPKLKVTDCVCWAHTNNGNENNRINTFDNVL